MRENRDFVVPVNILTPLRTPRFLGPHDTLPCVLLDLYLLDTCIMFFVLITQMIIFVQYILALCGLVSIVK